MFTNLSEINHKGDICMDEEMKYLMEVVNERILYRNFLIETNQVGDSEKEELEEEIKKLKTGLEKIVNIFKEELKMKIYLATYAPAYESDIHYYVGEDLQKAKTFYWIYESRDFVIEVWENGEQIGQYLPVIKEDEKVAFKYEEYCEEVRKMMYEKRNLRGY